MGDFICEVFDFCHFTRTSDSKLNIRKMDGTKKQNKKPFWNCKIVITSL